MLPARILHIPCWCGSQKPFGQCHLQHVNSQTNTRAALIAAHNDSKEAPSCEHPDAPGQCVGDIINSHTIQQSKILQSVAENGHVMTFRSELGHTLKHGQWTPKLLGTSKASIFKGFCSSHDKSTFSPIEDEDILPTPYQAFLLSYRTLVSEMRSKRELVSLNKSLKISTHNVIPTRQEVLEQNYIDTTAYTAQYGLRELAPLRKYSDIALQTKNVNEFEFYLIALAGQPSVVASQTISPEYGFSTTKIQDWRNFKIPLQNVSISCIPANDNTAIIIGWHKESERIGSHIVKTLNEIPNDNVGDVLHRFIFANAEQIYFRPSWWSSLDRRQQKVIKDLSSAGVDREASAGDHLPNSCSINNQALLARSYLKQ